jgi:hypothetical protein
MFHRTQRASNRARTADGSRAPAASTALLSGTLTADVIQDSAVDRLHDSDERGVVHPAQPGHDGAREAEQQSGDKAGGDGGGDQHVISQAT